MKISTLSGLIIVLSLVSASAAQGWSFPGRNAQKLTCEEKLAIIERDLRLNNIVSAITMGIAIIFFILGSIWGYMERNKRGEVRAMIGRPYNDSERGGEFNSGLCDHICNCRICLPTLLFPCFMIAFNRTDIDNRECSWQDCLCSPTIYQSRQSLRTKYEMRRDPCLDLCCVAFCSLCVVCQDAREIEIREAMSDQSSVIGYSNLESAVPVATVSTELGYTPPAQAPV